MPVRLVPLVTVKGTFVPLKEGSVAKSELRRSGFKPIDDACEALRWELDRAIVADP